MKAILTGFNGLLKSDPINLPKETPQTITKQTGILNFPVYNPEEPSLDGPSGFGVFQWNGEYQPLPGPENAKIYVLIEIK